ncbi:MAG: hypothetical protein SGPRY_004276, partial [Prymnesium sp.]
LGKLKRLGGASVRVVLLDAQRFGEMDEPHMRPHPPDRSLLPPGELSRYGRPGDADALSSLLSSEERTRSASGDGGGEGAYAESGEKLAASALLSFKRAVGL